jgi:hypothetical protein
MWKCVFDPLQLLGSDLWLVPRAGQLPTMQQWQVMRQGRCLPSSLMEIWWFAHHCSWCAPLKTLLIFSYSKPLMAAIVTSPAYKIWCLSCSPLYFFSRKNSSSNGALLGEPLSHANPHFLDIIIATVCNRWNHFFVGCAHPGSALLLFWKESGGGDPHNEFF